MTDETGKNPDAGDHDAGADGREPRVIGTSRSQRRERLRPAELVIFALVLAVFVGVIVILALRNPLYALIAFGVSFIVALVGLAMFALGSRPDEDELRDLREQDEGH